MSKFKDAFDKYSDTHKLVTDESTGKLYYVEREHAADFYRYVEEFEGAPEWAHFAYIETETHIH